MGKPVAFAAARSARLPFRHSLTGKPVDLCKAIGMITKADTFRARRHRPHFLITLYQPVKNNNTSLLLIYIRRGVRNRQKNRPELGMGEHQANGARINEASFFV
jgi:hypothetical protein